MGIFKRLGASALAMGVAAIGIVSVAPAASAHANSVTGTAACKTDGTYTVTWKIKNDYQYDETVAYIGHQGGSVDKSSITIGQHGTGYIASTGIPGSATSASLTVQGTWSDGFVEKKPVTGEVTLPGTCGDDDAVKQVTYCHATPPADAKNGYNRLTTAVEVVYNAGHVDHKADIIPPFTYKKHGDVMPFPGKNWDDNGQRIYNNGCKVPDPPKPPCVSEITSANVTAAYVSGNPFQATVTYTGKKLCDGVTKKVSLNSYATDGPTWETSGTQVFNDHDTITLSKTNTSGYLYVDAPSCYYQTDLYWGDTKYDGVDGALPHYPNSVTPHNLIAARNGGHACEVKPSGKLRTDCFQDKGKVVAYNLDAGTFPGTQFQLVTLVHGVETVVAGPAATNDLVATGLADHTKVALQYRVGSNWVAEGSEITTGVCTPVLPTGNLETQCDDGAATVVASHLRNGTYENVDWRLVTRTEQDHTTVLNSHWQDGKLVATDVADTTKVWLQAKVKHEWVDIDSITTGVCVVQPSGNLITACDKDAAFVKAVDLSSGTQKYVAWRLVTADGTELATSGSHGPLVAVDVKAGTVVKLQYKVKHDGDWVDEGSTVTAGQCVPTAVIVPDCLNGAGRVIATVNAHDAKNVQWRLVDANGTPVESTTVDNTITATNLADGAIVKVQYSFDGETWKYAADASATVPACAPPVVVNPTGSYDVACSPEGANVTIKALDAGTNENVTWTLSVDGVAKPVAPKDVIAVKGGVALVLAYRIGESDAHTVQSGKAPEACPVPPKTGGLGVVKSVDTASTTIGGTLTYTLTVTATGELVQHGVTVTDYVPGYDPAVPSGKTSYVDGSATCDGAGCTSTYDATAKQLTWKLGDLPGGATRTLTFKVTVDAPATLADGGTPKVTLVNAAAVGSTETAKKPSNQVVTQVTAVAGVKQGSTPTPTPSSTPSSSPTTEVEGTKTPNTTLPHTGAGFPIGWTVLVAGLLTGFGVVLTVAARRREVRISTD